MKYLFLLMIMFLVQLSWGQIVIGNIIDEDDRPLPGATIINTNSNVGTTSNENGEFVIKTLTGDYLRLSFIGKQTVIKQIPLTKQDTVYLLFIMKDDITKIKEFTVSSKRIQKVISNKNESIIDYIPLLDGKIILLKKIKKTYFLSLEEIDTVYYKVQVDYIKPTKFTQDCYGNIHLFCQKKVRQLWISDTILSLYEYSYENYNQFLKPLLYCNETSIITENFSNHNKKYQIHHTTVSSKERQKLYETWDKEAEKVAASWYYQIIGNYYAKTSPEANLIENGVWDGNVISLQISGDIESTVMVSWYLKVRAREMNIQSFASHDQLFLFDLQTDTVTIMNQEGQITSTNHIKIGKTKASTTLIFDKIYTKFYYYDANKSFVSVYELNPQTGSSKKVISLTEVKYIKNLKINNGWLYFVKKDKFGHQKLYRVNIP